MFLEVSLCLQILCRLVITRRMEMALSLHKALQCSSLQRKKTSSLRRIKVCQPDLWFGFILFHHTLVPAACSVKVTPSSLITLPVFTGDTLS